MVRRMDARTEIVHEVTGGGHPVVLVHAGVADSTMWDPQVDALAVSYCVIRYELPGYPLSPQVGGEICHHEVLAGLLDRLGVPHAHLVGASIGGRIALDLSLARPDLVDSLVLVGTPVRDLTEPDEELRPLVEAMRSGQLEAAVEASLRAHLDGPRRAPDQVDPALREYVRGKLELLYAQPGPRPRLRWLEPPAAERLGAVRAPTLVVVGSEETRQLLAAAGELEAGIPGAARVVVPDAAHMVTLERAYEFNQLLLEFLERHTPG